MVKKYTFGKIFETYAVVADIAEDKSLQYFSVTPIGAALKFEYVLDSEDAVYGLGETVGAINKRGEQYISFNTDEVNHTPTTKSLYGSHNFIVVDGKQKFGAFFDTPSKVFFDIDVENSGKIEVTVESGNVRLYIVECDSAENVVKNFLTIIGQGYVPPLWAFGYGQSRWGYKTESDIRRVVQGYRKAGIPLDYVCMDIDYMDGFADFTVDKRRFPDLKGFATEMKQSGVRLVPIIDAGVKIKEGYSVYEEGVANDYFCKRADGKPFRVAVWPGMTHFPDFTKEEVRDWFGSQYKALTDCGIEGFWNDMNEPSIFYSEFTEPQTNQQKETAEPNHEQEALSNAYKDYKNFYHDVDGKLVCHYDLHNIYGYFMTMSAGEQLKKLVPNRYFLFSRSSYIGAHRYGGIWTGDNKSTWEHLKMNIRQMPSLNMCGFLFSGADTGGFGGDTTRELLLRWLAFSVFTPLMRNHTAIRTKKQECYAFNGKKDFKNIISLRYRLLPYIYSEYVKAVLKNDMYFKPLSFVYSNDATVKNIEDQLLVGDSIMSAPITDEGATSRKVYLPEDMTEVRYRNGQFECVAKQKGQYIVNVPLNEVVFYIRSGKLVPTCKGADCVERINLEEITLLGDGTTYEQYIDDGATYEINEKNVKILSK